MAMTRLSLFSATVSTALFRVAGITPATPTSSGGIYKVDAYDPFEALKKFIKNPSTGLLHYLFIIVGAAALIYIAWGGISYMQAGEDPKKAGEARNAIINGVIGLAIAIGAFTIISIGVGIGSTVNNLEDTSVNFNGLSAPEGGNGGTKATPTPQVATQCINLATKTTCKPVTNACVIVTSTGKTSTACKDESGVSCRCSATDIACGSSSPCAPVTPPCVCTTNKNKSCSTASDCGPVQTTPTSSATAAATVDPNWGDSNDLLP